MENPYCVPHKPWKEYFDQPICTYRFFKKWYEDLYLGESNEDAMLGTPDADHQVIALMMRIHLTPSNICGVLFPREDNSLPRDDTEDFS